MSPEMMSSSKYDESSDIYSLGLLFIEIYTGKNPFHHVETKSMFDILEKFKNKTIFPSFPNTEIDKCPPIVISLLKQMTNYEPKERPSISVVVQTLKDKKVEKQLKKLINK